MHRPQYMLRRWLLATLAAAVLISTATAGPAAASGLGPDWVAKGSGEFTTKDRYDRVKYRIEHDAIDRSMVEFQLDADLGNWCLWGKTLVMPDGLSSEWPIHIDPSQGEFVNSDRLWAGQVQNGQELRLYKAGFLGWSKHVLNLGYLGGLQPGDRVVFTWLHDSQWC